MASQQRYNAESEEHAEQRIAPDHNSMRPSVKFYPNVLVYHIDCSFTEEETQAVWYSAAEVHLIKQECLATVRILADPSINENGNYVDNDVFCMRGLECRTQEGWERRSFMKRCSKEAVLDQQDRMWERGIEDGSSSIAKAYSLYSIPSHTAARRMGLNDERHELQGRCHGNNDNSKSLISSTYVVSASKLPSTAVSPRFRAFGKFSSSRSSSFNVTAA